MHHDHMLTMIRI